MSADKQRACEDQGGDPHELIKQVDTYRARISAPFYLKQPTPAISARLARAPSSHLYID
ncbi:MAG TPA: hypothetical protein VGN34_07535 [Ktedonobacteraceae bacterium]